MHNQLLNITIDLNLTNPSLYIKEGVTHIHARYRTKHSFDRHIYESKEQLENQLCDLNLLIIQIEENTEKAIGDKEQYLKLAHIRLDIRHKRPNIEFVYDSAQKLQER